MSSIMTRYSAMSPYRLMRQEAGFPVPIGAGNAMSRSLYCGMNPMASWSCQDSNAPSTGGIFNLEFSPDGSILVAACEKKSLQLFDPVTYRKIGAVAEAHEDCVNCVKFLDARMFATCSDDTSIAIWDVRNLKKKSMDLRGHSNWVKNIEFSVQEKLLVSSGLDGSIFTWDINSRRNTDYKRVFQASGLMRCRLTPDAKQMVMSTTGGLLVIIHDLNLATLYEDLVGFKPNLYRLMQMSNQVMPIASNYDHLFDNDKVYNRVEFVSDFPHGNDAEVVSSLQIHPQGWTALSRNVSHDDKSEWSCIHDIQPYQRSEKSVRDSSPQPSCSASVEREAARKKYNTRSSRRRTRLQAQMARAERIVPHNRLINCSGDRVRRRTRARQNNEPTPGTSRAPTPRQPLPPLPPPPSIPGMEQEEAEGEFAAADAAQGAQQDDKLQNDLWVAFMTVRQQRLLLELATRGQIVRNFNMQRIMGLNTGIIPTPPPKPRPARRSNARRSGPRFRGDSSPEPEADPPARTIRQNRDRLLYYVKEANEGKGFIKELCYSADGRIVCSPFGRGMRLLAINDTCSELAECVTAESSPQEMVELGQSLGIHEDLTVSSKFSPRQPLLVTGCLAGRIVWYLPSSE